MATRPTTDVRSIIRAILRAEILIAVGWFGGCAFGGFVAAVGPSFVNYLRAML